MSGDWPPNLDIESLPKSEQNAVSHVPRLLLAMANYTNDFRGALALYQFSTAKPDWAKSAGLDMGNLDQWRFIAARDGAMSIYHFAKAMEDIMAAIGTCQALLTKINRSILRSSRKRLRDLFPNFEAVRHSITHAAELIKDIDEHLVSGPYVDKIIEIKSGEVILRNCFIDDNFANTFEGKIQSYEISAATLTALNTIRIEFYSAFEAAEKR